jgi:ubiquinone/menaquinone biosynthesis C-methylase UbiE
VLISNVQISRIFSKGRAEEPSLRNEDKVKQEWNQAAEAWGDFVRTGRDYYRDGLNNPEALKLIGDLKSLVVLDLACGEGYNTRILAEKGAKVTGVDFAEKMIRFAQQRENAEKLGIRYEVMDATNLGELPSNHFDLVTCFMSLQDIRNLRRAVSEVAGILKERGRFVFSIPHPCFERIRLSKHKRTASATEQYFGVHEYTINWNMQRLTKHFVTTTFHRPLANYFDALYGSILLVQRLVEPKPNQAALRRYPELQDVQRKPQSVIIESVKYAQNPT